MTKISLSNRNNKSKMIKVEEQKTAEISSFIDCDLADCVNTLDSGGVIVFPTETIYGLGVDINNDTAIDRLIQLKGRPENLPIAVAVSGIVQASPLV